MACSRGLKTSECSCVALSPRQLKVNKVFSMKLNEHAIRAYNAKATDLVQKLTVRRARQRPKKPSFVVDAHVSASIPFTELRNLKMSRSDREGNEASKSFYHDGITFELGGQDYQILKRVAEGMHKTPELRDTVSVTVLKTLIFEWIEKTHKKTTTLGMTEFVLAEVEPTIQDFEVWIPIAATRIQSEFDFGNMRIRTITRAMLDEWEAESRKARPDASAGHDVFFKRWRKALLGLAAATIDLRAEPGRAYELASAEAERTLGLLRCLSGYNCFPFTVNNSVPLGQENRRGYQYFMTHQGRIVFPTSGFEGTPYDEWRIDNDDLALMKSYGMDKFSALLKVRQPTTFQKDLLRVLQLYGKSSTFKNPADKLAYILAPLEALLRSDRSQNIDDMADRLVMFVDKEASGRKGALLVVRDIYDRRLSFVHSEHTKKDLELLEKFMVIAWTFFINVIGYANAYESRLEFINAIDNLKFSGGLP
jgi:hypothetical protein